MAGRRRKVAMLVEDLYQELLLVVVEPIKIPGLLFQLGDLVLEVVLLFPEVGKFAFGDLLKWERCSIF